MRLYFSFLILIVTLQGCESTKIKEVSPTFREAFFAKEAELQDYFSLDFPKEKMVKLFENWEYLGMDSIAGIDSELRVGGSVEALNLPHRLQAPNQNFWYQKRLQLEPGVLWIDADDGAQLWVGQERIARSSKGDFYEVKDSGERLVTIRAVNNAMAGGLRSVNWMSSTDFLQERSRIKVTRDSLFLKRKLDLLQDENLLEKIERSSQAELKKLVETYPMLLTEPLVIYGSGEKPYLRWVSEKGGTAHLEFADGSEVEVFSSDGVFTLLLENHSDLSYALSQEESNLGTFHIPAEWQSGPIKIAVWGDSQGGWNTFRQIASQINKHDVLLSLGAGDLVNNGSEDFAYLRFLQSLSQMNTRQIPVPGNHDYDGFYENLDPKAMKRYVFEANAPTYGFHRFGPVAMLTLDPNENFPVSLPEDSSQWVFMNKTLNSEEWKSATWKIIALHQPPFSQGWPGYSGEQSILEALNPYLHAGAIDLVIAGHTHDYERLTKDFSGNSVTFLVVGGAGGGIEPLRESSSEPVMDTLIKVHHFGILELDEKRMDWKVFGVEGEFLDSLSVRK